MVRSEYFRKVVPESISFVDFGEHQLFLNEKLDLLFLKYFLWFSIRTHFEELKTHFFV